LTPTDGPNGVFAEIVNGQLVIDIEVLNAKAGGTIGDVFTITNNSESTIALDYEKQGEHESDIWFIPMHYVTIILEPGHSHTVSIGYDTQDHMPGVQLIDSFTIIATVV